MTETTEACHWNGERRVTARHLRGCEVPGCEGCEPCTKSHCTMPRCANHLRDHEPLVCDRCVGKVREHLVRIVQLCGFAPYVAATSTYGAAVVILAGPVPEHSTYRARYDWAVYYRGLCRCQDCPDLQPVPEGPECDQWKSCKHHVCRRRSGRATCPTLAAWLDVADDERHPLWVLGSWDMLVAQHLGHHRTLKVNVDTAASYLTANLTDLARMEDFAFDELAREVDECVDHVERVLLLALRQETGAPCPVCHSQGRKAKPLVREFDEADLTGDSDHWACPRSECGQQWTLDEYDKYVEREYRSRADRLTASQIATTYRVPEGSVRGWASLGKVRIRGKDHHGLTLYDVGDTLGMRDGDRVRTG